MRRWKYLSTNFATLCARLSNTGALMIINGVAARCMSRDQFGLWSMLYFINLFTNGLDLGFQFTLGNRLAALGSLGADGEAERRETFLSILFLQAGLYAVYCVIVLLAVPLMPWARWFRITDPLLAAQVVRFMPVALIVMIGTLPVGLIWTVFFAYGEIKLASALGGVCNALQTAAFVVAAYVFKFKFASLVLVYFSCNILLNLILTFYVLIRRKWRFSFLPLSRMAAIVRSLARVSFHAFFLTILGIISNILAPLASGAVAGLAVAGDFTIIQRLFAFLVSSHLAVMAPVAPSVTRDSHTGNWDAVRRRLRVYVFRLWPVYFLVGGGIVWCFHPWLIRLWAGHTFTSYPLAALLLAWACLSGFANTFSVFLNSLGLIKVQAALSFAMLLPNVLLLIFFSRWLGLSGIVLSSALCVLPAAILWPFYTRRALRLQMLRV